MTNTNGSFVLSGERGPASSRRWARDLRQFLRGMAIAGIFWCLVFLALTRYYG